MSKNIKECTQNCAFNGCEKSTDHPSKLKCCGQFICIHHLTGLRLEKKSVFKCCFCDEEFYQYSEISKPNESTNLNVQQAENALSNMISEIEKFENFHVEEFIRNQSSIEKEKINYQRKELIKKINRSYTDIIDDLAKNEQECLAKIKTSVSVKFELDSLSHHVKEWNLKFKEINHHENLSNKMNNELEKLKIKFQDYKKDLLSKHFKTLKLKDIHEKNLIGTLDSTANNRSKQAYSAYSFIFLRNLSKKVEIGDINGNRHTQFRITKIKFKVTQTLLLSTDRVLFQDESNLHLFDLNTGSYLRSFLANSDPIKTFKLNNSDFVTIYSNGQVFKWYLNNHKYVSHQVRLSMTNNIKTCILNSNGDLLVLSILNSKCNLTVIKTEHNLEMAVSTRKLIPNIISRVPGTSDLILVHDDKKLSRLAAPFYKSSLILSEVNTIKAIEMVSPNFLITAMNGNNSKSSIINIWDLATIKCLKFIRIDNLNVTSMRSLNESGLICHGTERIIKVFDIDESKQLLELDDVDSYEVCEKKFHQFKIYI